MENNYTVYRHVAPNGKIYVGITGRSVERRWQNGRNYKSSPHFNHAINMYGWENIKHEILFTGLTKGQAEQKEIELIAEFKSDNPLFGYNIESGGNAIGKLNEETKKKISIANKGRKIKNRRPHTDEEKKRISEKLKGRTSPMKNKHWTDEQRARVGTPIICIETGAHFYSLKEAERQTGLDHSAISKVLKGVYKQTGGMHFEYARK